MKNLFTLRGQLPSKTKTIIEIIGVLLLLLTWQILSSVIASKAILPGPGDVFFAFGELQSEDFLIGNCFHSIGLNFLGYMEAIIIAIPIGFAIGLFPIFNSLTGKYIDAMRFIPLTALTGLFIAWFGIETNMKVQFLAFGILVYLLPVVVSRVLSVEKVYEDTAYTLGATKWQMIKKVFFPDVTAKLSDDIRVLVAISWTYIIVAELINKSGGIGSLIFTSARQSRLDKVFAILLVIILIGFLQDKLFKWLDRKLFPYKY